MSRPLPRRAFLAVAVTAAAAGCAKATHGAAPAPTATPTTSAGSPTSASSSSAPATTGAVRRPSGPSIEVMHGPRSRPEVALTFHGQGSPTIAKAVLGILDAHHAKGTVMAVGTWLATYPDMARVITSAGHELGNHTWSHQPMDRMSESQINEQIARCKDILVKLTGSPGAYFRRSDGQHATPLIRKVAGRLGYRVCLSYDVDSLDWTDPGTTAIRKAVATARRGSIVSMHLGHQQTVDVLPGVLSDLAARGLKPVTASRLLRA